MATFLPIVLRCITASALVLGLSPGAVAAEARAPEAATAAANTAATTAARAALKAAPAPGTSGLGLIANRGQWPSAVLYMAPIKGGRAWVTASGIVYDFSKPAKRKQGMSDAEPGMPEQPHARKSGAQPQPERVQGHVVRLDFAGAMQPAVRPKGK